MTQQDESHVLVIVHFEQDNNAGSKQRATVEQHSEVEQQHASPPCCSKRTFALVVLLIGVFLSALDQMITLVALPSIVDSLGQPALLPWVVTSYLVTSAASTPLFGRLSDVYGRSALFLTTLFLFIAGSAVSGASTDIWMLVGGRAVQGIGGGGLLSLATIMIGDIVEPSMRGAWHSSLAILFSIASVLGPVLGGILTKQISWRWIFYINLPLGLPTLIIAALVLTHVDAKRVVALEARPQHGRCCGNVDVIGAALIVLATVLVLLALGWGGVSYTWQSPLVLVMLVLGTVAFLAFIAYEAWLPSSSSSFSSSPSSVLPLINVRLFVTYPELRLALALVVTSSVPLYGLLIYVPVYLVAVQDQSTMMAGLELVPLVIGMTLASVVQGQLMRRDRLLWGRRIPVTGTATLILALGLLSTLQSGTPYHVVWAIIFVAGTAVGQIMPVVNVLVQNAVPPADMASSISACLFVRLISGSLGVAAFATVINNDAQQSMMHGMQQAYLGSLLPATMALFSALWFWFAGEKSSAML